MDGETERKRQRERETRKDGVGICRISIHKKSRVFI
jgi:hypothetical protein